LAAINQEKERSRDSNPYNTNMQYRAIQGNTGQYRAIQGNTGQYTGQYRTIQDNTGQYRAIQDNTGLLVFSLFNTTQTTQLDFVVPMLNA
jgi:hypothetical protein